MVKNHTGSVITKPAQYYYDQSTYKFRNCLLKKLVTCFHNESKHHHVKVAAFF